MKKKRGFPFQVTSVEEERFFVRERVFFRERGREGLRESRRVGGEGSRRRGGEGEVFLRERMG